MLRRGLPHKRRIATLGALILAGSMLVLPAGSANADPGRIFGLDDPNAIPNQYIVDLKESVPRDQTAAEASRLLARFGGTNLANFTAIMGGFAMTATPEQAALIAGDPAVALVEQDAVPQLRDTQMSPPWPSNPPWHLDRIDQTRLPLDFAYRYGFSRVPIYVVDSGVNVTHTDFGGRASAWFNAFRASGMNIPDEDCAGAARGHGTVVAGAAAGRTYGVSKDSAVYSVKVLDCRVRTDLRFILDGIEEIKARGQRPAVVNISLGYDTIKTQLDNAVVELIEAGFTVTIAAANSGADSCYASPDNITRRTAGAIVVGATDQSDKIAQYVPGSTTARSNWGPCVSMFAPGKDIVGPSWRDTTSTETLSGCSFAAPQVAGAAALILAKHPTFTPQQVRAALLADATPGRISDPDPALDPFTPASSKRLLYVAPPEQQGTASGNSLEEMFRNYGNQGGHWTGGDETMSVKLPDNRVAWFFGDSFLGTVNADRTRPRNTPMVNNAVVVQQGNSLVQTLTGGTPAAPTALVGAVPNKPPGDLGWWPGEARLLNNNKLQVFYTHVNSDGGGHLSFKTVGRAIATFSLPGLTLDGLTPIELNTNARIGWGAAMVDGKDGYTYIYGSEMVDRAYHMYVARAPQGQLAPASTWQFWTGSSDISAQWSANDADAKPTISGVGSGFSVKYLPARDEYVLATQDTTQPFSARFVAMFAKEPTGPFVHQTTLFTAPEASVPNAYVYTAKLHQEFASGSDQLVVSYNVNSFASDDAYNNVELYRPHFRTVEVPRVPDYRILPDAPKNLTATSPSPGKVRLSWTAPAGSNLKYWIYERNTDAVTPPGPQPDPIPRATHFERSSTSYTSTTVELGLLTAGTYEYKVAAENSTGEGPPSLPATITVTIPPPATAPANLTATANDDGTIGLRWDPVAAAGWVNYRVYSRDVTAGETTLKEASTAEVSGATAVVKGLTNAHTYAFSVTAWNNTGEGPQSATAQATCRVPPPPAPTNLTARANDDGTITLNWNSAGPPYWYWVYYQDADDTDDPAEFTRAAYPVSSGTTFTAGYLTSGHRYRFYVTSIGEQGVDSAPSNIAEAEARVAPPGAPTNLRATANEDGTVTLTWTAPAPDLWYWVYAREAGVGDFIRREYPVVNGPTVTLGLLELGKPLEFYVTTIGEGDTESAPSNTVRVTPGVPPPPAPTSLTATANQDGTVTLNWNGAGPDDWYWVYLRNTRTQATFGHGSLPATTTTATMGGLSVGDRYEFYVTTIGQGNESARSNTVSAVSYVPPPAAPGALTATAGDGEVRLSWRAPAAGVWHWVYSRNTRTDSGFTRSAYPIDGATTATLGWLSNGDRYEFYVTAIGQGNTESAPSNTVSTVPHAPRPAAPSNLTATSNTNGSITLNWGSSGSGVWYSVSMRNATAGSAWVRLSLPVSGGTTFTAGGLALKDFYEFRVVALGQTSGFDSPASNVARAQSKIPLPAAPALSGQPKSNGDIALSWTAPAPGLWYWIYLRDVTAGEGFVRQKYPVSKGTTFTAGMLKLNHAYEFRVSAINAMGEGALSNVYRATSTMPAPSGLSAGWTARTTAHLTWNGDPSWFYYVYVSESGGPFIRNAIPVTGRTWQDVVPLSADGYRFYVTRAGNGGETAPSNIATVSTPFPLPAAGTVATYHGASTPRCVEYVPGLYGCSSTVSIKVSMASWSTRFQHNGTLNLRSRITVNGDNRNVSTSCFDLAGVYRCDVTFSTQVNWTGLSGSGFLGAPTVCVNSTAFADYYRNPRGTLTRVSASQHICFTPGTPEA